MKNKKGVMEISMTTILIIVIAMSMFILGLVLVKNMFDKPEFKITKEECFFGDAVNIDFNINNYYASKVLGLSEYNLHALINGNENITCDEHVCTVSFRTNLTICEEVEYDEIKIYELAIWETNGWFFEWCEEKPEDISWSDWDVRSKCSCNGRTFSYEGNESYVKSSFDEVKTNKSCRGMDVGPHIIKEEKNITISKKGLSTTWLGENCKPNYDSAIKKCEEDNEYLEVCAIQYFKEYQCGNYTIEVVK